MILNNNSP